jgi:hypothetical protein
MPAEQGQKPVLDSGSLDPVKDFAGKLDQSLPRRRNREDGLRLLHGVNLNQPALEWKHQGQES